MIFVRLSRMREKALWLSLLSMLISVSLLQAVTSSALAATPKAKLCLDPKQLPKNEGLGHPGDEYYVSVDVSKADNLWAVQFTIAYAPYVSVLVASEFTEGPFLSEDGTWPTLFYYTIDPFQGRFTVVILRLGEPGDSGVSGAGTLATFKLTVVEAGESPIDIVDSILLDSQKNSLLHKTSGSYYYGATADLVNVEISPDRNVPVGENMTIHSTVRNDGDVPLWVRVRFDIARAEDGRRIQFHSGQTYFGGGLGEPRPFTYLYVDEFNEWYYEWNHPPETVFGPPDGTYIEGDANAQWASLYSFEDLNLAGDQIAEIFIEGYTQYPNGANDAVDIDVYGFSSVSAFSWLGSLWGTPDWGWHGVRWTTDNVLDAMPELADETELNNMELLIYNYHGDAPNIIRVDSVRLKVEFATVVPVYVPMFQILPGEEKELDPAIWVTKSDHIGSYELTATLEYTSEFFRWNSWSSKQKMLFFWIVEPKE